MNSCVNDVFVIPRIPQDILKTVVEIDRSAAICKIRIITGNEESGSITTIQINLIMKFLYKDMKL